MKITVNQLRKIIKEEISKSLNENEVDVRKEVKQIILNHKDDIEDLLKDPTRTYSSYESYSELMQPIIDDIIDDINKGKYGDEGIDAYNSLIQTDPDLKDLLAFKYPSGYHSPKERPSEPEDVDDPEYLDTIDRNRGLYGPR